MNTNKFKSDILQDLFQRGFLYQFTDAEAMDELFLNQKEIVFYIGYDPTAKSLHIGHLLWIKLVNKLQKAGLKPIVLTGGATARIGDPTWKHGQRVMLESSVIFENTSAIMKKLAKLVKFGETGNLAISLNNDDWLSKINYLEFLKNFGSMFSVNKMLTMDSVNTRLEKQQHLSFLEFNYMLLQAYDFLYLFENYNCRIQLGGADQWANMIFGVDLIRKKTEKLAFGMSVPLLLNSDGTKMGKTESGAIWLDSKLTSPFDFWQYWRNIDDKDVPKLMRLFTDVPVKEIDEYEKLVGSSEINNIKIILADAITSFVHEDADIGAINEAAVQKFHHITKAHNSIGVETFVIEKGTKIDQALVLTKLASSKTAGKRLIDGHAIKINDKIISDYDETIEASCIIFVGKKKFIHIKIHDV